MFKKSTLALCCLSAMVGCNSFTGNDRVELSPVEELANSLDVKYQVVDNHAKGAADGRTCSQLGADYSVCAKINIVVTNDGPASSLKGWSMYYHSIRPILAVDSDKFKVTHITGDLHRIEPTEAFRGMARGESFTVPLVTESWKATHTDFMPRMFITSMDGEAANIASTDTEDLGSIIQGLEGDQVQFSMTGDNTPRDSAQARFAANESLRVTDVTSDILPTPKQVVRKDGELVLTQEGLDLSTLPLSVDTKSALVDQVRGYGVPVGTAGLPVVATITGKASEDDWGQYELSITKEAINIEAPTELGVFYAMQSVLSLVDVNNASILPLVEIQDSPRFEYRGFMVDIARNFHSMHSLMKTVDQMASLKMNKLHIHMSEDEGWRLEIPGLPELTDVGSNRCFDLTETECLLPQLGSGAHNNNFGSGYLSREDYIELLQYAKARNVNVIPEFDMPAHARAAVISMEARHKKYMAKGDEEKANEYRLIDEADESNVTTVQFYDRQSFLNPCLESSNRFISKVVSEVKAMHDEAGAPLEAWHYGGDEAKNIKLGHGFQDKSEKSPVASKGIIDLDAEHKPYELSPQCQAYKKLNDVQDHNELLSGFAEDVSAIAKKQGIDTFAGWQDGFKYAGVADEHATANVRINLWETVFWGADKSVNRLINDGYDVVLSNPDFLYFDMPNSVDEAERGYYWATRATNTKRVFSYVPENLPQNAELAVNREGNNYESFGEVDSAPIHGISAALWSETIRTDEQYEYMAFPRLLAVAERSWAKGGWEIDYKPNVKYSIDTKRTDVALLNDEYERFANIIGSREMAKMDMRNINYRLPLPGAIVKDGQLEMNIEMPGLVMQYSIDNGVSWSDYVDSAKPMVGTLDVLIRSVSPSGERVSRETSIK